YFTEAHIPKGDADLKLGKNKEALESFQNAAKIYPGLVSAHQALVRAYKALALNDEVKKEQQQIDQMEKTQ
ncbi:MAG: hypothetical protein K2X93_22320, partial [Candidatus Obscuribacterales bacterium]|nr:hypothetical protein [Candidatus Obscuribacterales bacterium]